MRRTLIIPVLALALAACSSDDQPEAQDAVDAVAEAGVPPKPDQATADAYIAALDAIDPAIDRDDPESAINRGRDQCSTIKSAPGDRARQVDTVNQRFTDPDHPTGWGPDIAGQILDVVHQHLCPTW